MSGNLSRHQANLIDQGNLTDEKVLTSGKPQQIRKASAGVRKTSADITKNLSRHQENLIDQGNLTGVRSS
jgi:hypothetical protein